MKQITIPSGLNLDNYTDEEIGFVLRHLYAGTTPADTTPYKVYQLYSYIYKYNNNSINNHTPSNSPKGEPEEFSEPDFATITRLFTEAGRPDLAEGFYHYYQKRQWRTKCGNLITDIKTAVSKWVARQFKPAQEADSKPSDTSENTSSTTADKPEKQPQKRSERVRTGKTNSRKPGANFHNFNQREVDYDELVRRINGGGR